jgi:hypothetical protein
MARSGRVSDKWSAAISPAAPAPIIATVFPEVFMRLSFRMSSMGETYIRAVTIAREIANSTEKGLESLFEASWDSCVSGLSGSS